MTGIFILIFVVSISLVSVMTVWRNSGQHVKDEMGRLGFGTITAWVSGISDIEILKEEIDGISNVERTGVQPVVFSDNLKGYGTSSFTAMRLRISFALQFGMVSLLGALIGVVCSAFLTDSLVAALLRMFGISNFSSHPSIRKCPVSQNE